MKLLKLATNKMAFGKVGIYGGQGAGKTFTAAKLAEGLYEHAKLDKPIAMFDTEPASYFIKPIFEKAGIPFYVFDESRALKDLMTFMDEAEAECSIAIIDSITHVWRDVQASYMAKINEGMRKKNRQPISKLEFHHWGPIKEQWGRFTDRFLSSKLHCIVCGRAGSVYEYQANEETGKKELITTGTKMSVEKEMGYEPSLLFEMVQVREEGRLVNRAIVQKDRSNTINAKEFLFPTFKNFKPHFDFLNIGGEHFGSMDQRDSRDLFTEDGFDSYTWDAKQKEIALDEIAECIAKHHPGQSADAKKAKGDLLEEAFGSRSWERIHSMKRREIESGRDRVWTKLEGKPYALPVQPLPANEFVADRDAF